MPALPGTHLSHHVPVPHTLHPIRSIAAQSEFSRPREAQRRPSRIAMTALFLPQYLSTCSGTTTPASADASLPDGCPSSIAEFGRSRLFRINPCPIDAKLTKGLDDAMRNITRLEMNRTLCPIQASEKFVTAEAAWIEHKMSCHICSGQQVGKVH